jgi:hypothetical protein
MALGALSLPAIEPAFNSEGTAMVPVTANRNVDQKLGTIEIKSPMDQVTEFFAGIDKSLIRLVEFAKRSFGLEEKQAQRDQLRRQDTDVPGDEKEDKNIIDTLKEQFSTFKEGFDKISIGEKLQAALLVGALALFVKAQDVLIPIVTAIVKAFNFVAENVFGDTENPKTNTLLSLLGIFAAFKFAPLVGAALTASKGILSATKSIGSAVFGVGKGSLKFVFEGINKAGALAFQGAKGALKLIEGGFQGLFNGIGKTFGLIRKGLVAMRAGSLAMLGPLLPAVAIAAAIGAVLYSLKSSIEVFKTSLDEGDSAMTAVGKAILDFTATLVTLPLTLAKKLLSFFAGMLGFSGMKEKLDNFSFKDLFINIITGFVNKVKDFFGAIFDFDFKSILEKIGNMGQRIATTLKGIAKGSVAMIAAAVPGGESPTEAFSRVYNEVLNEGEGAIKNETGNIDSLVDSGAMAAAKQAMTTNEAYNTTNNTVNNTTNIMKEKIIELMKQEIEKQKIIQETNKAPITIANTKGGDVINQSSNTYQSGEPNSDHTETTQKILTTAIA